MEEVEYKNIMDAIQGIRNEIAIIDRDLAKDRVDLGNFSIKLVELSEEVRQLRQVVGTNVQKVQDKVTEAVGPVISSTESLKKEIKKKKTIILTSNRFIDWFKQLLNGRKEEEKTKR